MALQREWADGPLLPRDLAISVTENVSPKARRPHRSRPGSTFCAVTGSSWRGSGLARGVLTSETLSTVLKERRE
ncbi:unnamed protein product [Boreogadus saida]